MNLNSGRLQKITYKMLRIKLVIFNTSYKKFNYINLYNKNKFL